MRKHIVAIASILAIGLATYGLAQVVPQPGPPVPIACAYNATPPTLTDKQAGWIQCNNRGKIIISNSSPGSQTYTVAGSYTFTVPDDVSVVYISGCGAGGPGAGGQTTSGSGGGGGGGALCVINTPIPVTPGSALAVTIPATQSGGAIGANGTDGGTTTVTGALIAIPFLQGGKTGVAGATSVGGAGGNGNGPLNGAGGAAATNSTRSVYNAPGLSGSGGGGGGSVASAGGLGLGFFSGCAGPTSFAAGGTGSASGGGGGGSLFGCGGLGGNGGTPSAGSAPLTGNYGAGGGGGGQNNTGGAGGAAFLFIRW